MIPLKQQMGFLLIPAAFLAAALLLSPGCLSPAGEKPGSGGTGAVLEGSSWDLLSYSGVNGTAANVLPDTRITVIFSAGGKLAGSAGCNHYFGDYREDGSSLSVGAIGSTLMACLDPGVMEQEGRYLSLLGSAARFRIDGDRLAVSDAAGTILLTYERERPPEPLLLTGTTWVLESISAGSGAVSSVLAGTGIDAHFSTDGKVTGSAGCNRYFADYSLTGSSLRVGTVGSTKMFCGEPAGRMEQEQTYLSLLGSVAGYGIDQDRLVLKDSREAEVLFFRGA